MSQLLASIARRNVNLATLGKSVENTLFPKDFELYLCAFELIEISATKKETVRYFVFPIMPDSMRESYRPATMVEQTAGGIVVSKYAKFVPRMISLNGSFGRSFKVLIGEKMFSLTNGFKTIKSGIKFFDDAVKTGYGCLKVLEDIIQQSNKIVKENNKEVFYQLIFHNLALGNSYLVEVSNFTQNQDMNTNMVWNYSLELKAIAPLSALYDKKELKNVQARLAASSVMKSLGNSVVKLVTGAIAKIKV